MTTVVGLGKIQHQPSDSIQRMAGQTDVDLVRLQAEALPPKAVIVEFGPWLGGVSAILAGYGKLHVVDHFIWSKNNDEKYPGIAQVNQSFRPVFERNLAEHAIAATIHECNFRDFTWDHGRLDLCFIDGPRTPKDLIYCLSAISDALNEDGRVLVKNGLNPVYIDMVAFIEVLLGKAIFELVQTGQPRWCNIVVLKPGPKIAAMRDFEMIADLFKSTPLAVGQTDPWGGPLFSMSRLAQLVVAADWPAVFDLLAQLPPDSANLYTWDELERDIDLPMGAEVNLAVFSELLTVQNDVAAELQGPIAFDRGVIWALRAYWMNNADKDWRNRSLDPGLIAAAFDEERMHWPTRLQSRVQGRDVVEIGRDLGLSGIGYLVAGARSYLGIETGDLTARMLNVEHNCEPITYIPVSGVESGFASAVDLCIVHGGSNDDPQTATALELMQTRLAEGGEVITISGHKIIEQK